MDRMSRDYNEKRNFIRMKIDTPAEVTIDNQGEKIAGICRDMSGGGLLIEVEKTMDTGIEVTVLLSSPHVSSPMLKAKAQVARVTQNKAGNYILGLEILQMLD